MRLDVDPFQFLSTSLGVQIFIVVSTVFPPHPVDASWDQNKQGLGLDSSGGVVKGVAKGAIQWLLCVRGHRIGSDTLLLGGTNVAPPPHISFSTWRTHDRKKCLYVCKRVCGSNRYVAVCVSTGVRDPVLRSKP